MGRVERIAAAPRLPRDRRRRDPHPPSDEPATFATHQPRQGRPIRTSGRLGLPIALRRSITRFRHPGLPELAEHAVALLDCLDEHRARQRWRVGHQRQIARPPISPVGRMLLLDDHVRATETDSGTAARFVRRRLAAAARGLGLEHAPAVVAGVDAQIRFLQHELDIVASDLLTGATSEACVPRGDASRPCVRPSRSLVRSRSSAAAVSELDSRDRRAGADRSRCRHSPWRSSRRTRA